jgi:hypothetical protein
MVESANKTTGSLKARVQRLSDLLALGVAKVIAGSHLADDMTTAKWNARARAADKWEFDKVARAPNVCHAGSYALDLPSYTQIGGAKAPAKRLTLREQLDVEHRKNLDSLLRGKGIGSPVPSYVKLWLPPGPDK